MLGHDASIGYVEAIKFAQQPNILDKRVGYLAVSLFLHENHELIVLLINTLQKDLRSTNVMEVCCALTAVCKLINKDMMPALLPQVLELVGSKRDIVRKKAVMALHSLYIKNPSAIPDVRELAKKSVGDNDPGVMSSSLHIFYELIKANPAGYKDLLLGFVNQQTMILEGKIAKDYDYHGVASPWIQMKLLRILALLGADDQKSSKKIYPVLGKTLSKLNTNSLISYAVAYECTRTITSIYPDKGLIDKAARCVGVFLVAKSNDIKYLGKWFKCFFFFLPSIIHVDFHMNIVAILTVCSWQVRLGVSSRPRDFSGTFQNSIAHPLRMALKVPFTNSRC